MYTETDPGNPQRRESRFERVWYGNLPAPMSWRLASWLYRIASAIRRGSYRLGLRRRYRAPVPVIVVGNVTVGGTGKTPLVIWIYRRLEAAGRKPGVLSRGYGGEGDVARLVEVDMPASLCGDEPLMMARRGLRVAVCSERPQAARLLLDSGCDLLIADDGLQHYRLARDLEIAVLDGSRGLGNRKLLPAGPLREPASRLKRVDEIVVNGGPSTQGTRMRLHGDTLVNLASGECEPLTGWRGRQVHGVAGIGNPERFFRDLEEVGLEVERHAFSDHHAFTPDELKFGDDRPLVTTEKDAVRMPPARGIWYLPVEADLTEAFEGRIVSALGPRVADDVHD